MALLISMVTVMVFLFGAMLYVRRRQMLAKKGIPSSRSNGAVLTTPIGAKHETPLWLDKETPPDYTSTLPEYAKLTQDYSRPSYNSLNGQLNINLHTNPLHQKEFSRPNCLGYNAENTTASYKSDVDRKLKDFCNMQVQDYASPNIDSTRTSQLADYAEVDANLIANNGAISPAPYATTTLVTAARRNGNSLVCIKALNNFC